MSQPAIGQRVRLVLEGVYSTFDTGVPGQLPWHELRADNGNRRFYEIALPQDSLLIVEIEVLE